MFDLPTLVRIAFKLAENATDQPELKAQFRNIQFGKTFDLPNGSEALELLVRDTTITDQIFLLEKDNTISYGGIFLSLVFLNMGTFTKYTDGTIIPRYDEDVMT